MSKKILVVSDTHGDNTNLKKAIANAGNNFDLMVHLGDIICSSKVIESLVSCPVEVVRGNCDSHSSGLKPAKLIDVAGHKAFITHGHMYGGQFGINTMKEIAEENGADIVMFGHTHEPLIEKYSNVTVINPGSLSRPRQANHKPTYIIMTVQDDGKIDYSLITM